MKAKKQTKGKQQILNTIPIFLAKTYKIVDNPEYNNIISWTQDGQAFIVKDINKLTTEIFPKHFKHSNFASFVRQLNMYGFHKVKTQQEGHAFSHQFFRRDDVQKLKDIKRRNGPTQDQQLGHESNMMVPLRRNYEPQIERQLSLIKSKHEDLQNCVSMLVEQNKQILMQNRSFVNKMSKMEERYRNKLETLMLLLLFGKAKNSNGQPFILPQQFQNMLESFSQQNGNSSFSAHEVGGKKKKQKKEVPLKMLKNESEAEIQRKILNPEEKKQKSKFDIDQLISEIDGQKKEFVRPRQDFDESIDFVPPSPHHSYLSFPDLYEKEPHQDVSDFLDNLQHSDYEDLGINDEKHEHK